MCTFRRPFSAILKVQFPFLSCVIDIPLVSLMFLWRNWCTSCVTDVPLVSLVIHCCVAADIHGVTMLHWCHCCSSGVTDAPLVSLLFLLCHWCSSCVTDIPGVTDVPLVSLMSLWCHLCSFGVCRCSPGFTRCCYAFPLEIPIRYLTTDFRWVGFRLWMSRIMLCYSPSQ